MVKGMIILGPAGSGKTALGKLAAKELGIAFLDIDDYIWRADTAVPYTVMYSRQEKIGRLLSAVNEAGEFVMAGSMNSFHEHFDPLFRLAVYLTADEALRMERVHQRELAEFGDRILSGGDMYEEHQKFLADVAGYEHGASTSNREQHELWLSQLTCPVLRLDGGEKLAENLAVIVEAYRKALTTKEQEMDRDNLLERLKKLDFDKKDYWLITGGAMVLYGLRAETGDMDLGCTKKMADALEANGHAPIMMDDGTRKFQYGENIEIFEDWLYDQVELVDGVPVISLNGLLTMKKMLGREKDLRDVELIEERIRNNSL